MDLGGHMHVQAWGVSRKDTSSYCARRNQRLKQVINHGKVEGVPGHTPAQSLIKSKTY